MEKESGRDAQKRRNTEGIDELDRIVEFTEKANDATRAIFVKQARTLLSNLRGMIDNQYEMYTDEDMKAHFHAAKLRLEELEKKLNKLNPTQS